MDKVPASSLPVRVLVSVAFTSRLKMLYTLKRHLILSLLKWVIHISADFGDRLGVWQNWPEAAPASLFKALFYI
jgi:hypothetical protein